MPQRTEETTKGQKYLSYSMALTSQAIENGYRYGFEIMQITLQKFELPCLAFLFSPDSRIKSKAASVDSSMVLQPL